MAKVKWDGQVHSIDSMIRDFIEHNRLTEKLEGGGTQKVVESPDGVLHVDWYGISNSKSGHWHFAFDIDEKGRAKNGRLIHK